MINEDDIETFITAKCKHSNANITFMAFYSAFVKWLGPNRLDECQFYHVLHLLSKNKSFHTASIDDTWHVLNCAIPENQIEMVSS